MISISEVNDEHEKDEHVKTLSSRKRSKCQKNILLKPIFVKFRRKNKLSSKSMSIYAGRII